MNLTSGSSVAWEKLLVGYRPTKECGREKGGFGGFGRWLMPHEHHNAWQNGALPMQKGNMT